jgi:transcriptional regulator with XRE-family HTH domain
VEISATTLNSLFGSKLSMLRRSRRISQAELGSRVGWSRTTIANLERGSQNVQLYQIFLLAQALDATPDQLIPTAREVQPNNAKSDEEFLQIAR